MTGSDNKKNLLKKLKRKAELSRYACSRIKDKNQSCFRIKQFSVVVLSAINALAIGLYFLNVIGKDWTLMIILVIPIAIVILESLDNTIFRWSDGINRYESGVQGWGSWIREADYVERNASANSKDYDRLLQECNRKYIECMDRSPQIPGRNFLKYKAELRTKVEKAKKIDQMDLDQLCKTEIWKKKNHE